MSFQKLDFCASTQVAMNAFHMFRNNTVNMVAMGQRAQDSHAAWESGLGKYPNDWELSEIASQLRGDWSKVRVHDVEKKQELGYQTETRRVDFYVKSGSMKIIFTAMVQRWRNDGDKPEDFSAWKAVAVTILRIWPTLGTTATLKLEAEDFTSDIMSPLMRGTFTGLLNETNTGLMSVTN